ncbi:MAG TPA: hypothetical protein VF144_19405 [Chitinophagaceae bacterium]
MKNYFKFASILLLASLIMISCTKVGGAAAEDNPDAVDQNDEVFPVITVSKPADNQVYTSGDSIIVEGIATDDKIVYKGKVQIKNDANNLVMADANYESHFLTAIHYRLAYKAIVTAATDFSILVEFQDHGANVTTKMLKVKANP